MSQTPNKTSRKISYGMNVVLGTILFAVILLTINYIAGQSNWRVDLTRDKIHTVSDASKKILGSLKDDVSVTIYATRKDTPQVWTDQRNQLINLLGEFREISNGRVKFTVKDPSTDPKIADESERKGVRAQSMQEGSIDQISVKIGYLGFTVDYKGKTEVVGQLRPDNSIEYQLTRAINKVAQVSAPVVGVMAPEGNPFVGEQGQFAIVPEILKVEAYEPRSISYNAPKAKDFAGLDMLMLFDPQELSEEALFHIDQYIMGGGHVLVAASGVTLDMQSNRVTPSSSNINALLQNYGVKINQNLVEDWLRGTQQQAMSMGMPILVRNPFIAQLSDLNKENPITKNLSYAAMVFFSTLSKVEGSTSTTVTPLINTSNRVRTQSTMFTLDIRQLKPVDAKSNVEPEMVAALVTGPFRSRYAMVAPPDVTNDDGTTRAVNASEVKRDSTGNPRIVVFATSLGFINDVINQSSGIVNALLLLNSADAMTRGGEMIALRSRQVRFTQLRDYTEQEAMWARVLAVGGVPLLLVGVGLVAAGVNRRRKNRNFLKYSEKTTA